MEENLKEQIERICNLICKDQSTRDPKRIEPFLETLNQLWSKMPDYRFGQLLYLLANSMYHTYGYEDMFFPEDDKWIEVIEKEIANLEMNKQHQEA